MAGVVYYPAGSNPCFERDTVIQPDNQLPIPHARLARQESTGDYSLVGQMPADFKDRLIEAARASVTMDGRQQKRLWIVLGVD